MYPKSSQEKVGHTKKHSKQPIVEDEYEDSDDEEDANYMAFSKDNKAKGKSKQLQEYDDGEDEVFNLAINDDDDDDEDDDEVVAYASYM